MHFEENFTYHVYNRSNETVFKTERNYIYFLEKFRHYILPFCDVLAWCLMPNHFHFMLVPNSESVKPDTKSKLPDIQALSKQFGTLLSSYTKALNKENDRRGQLFSHNTKAVKLNHVLISDTNNQHTIACFRYIHNNPRNAGLCNDFEWKFSSYPDFDGARNGSLVNKKLAMNTVNYDLSDFYAWSNINLSDEEIDLIL